MKKMLLSLALCLLCCGTMMAQETLHLTNRNKPLLASSLKNSTVNAGFYYMFDSYQTKTFHNSVAGGLLKANGGLGGDFELGLFGPFSIEAGGFACMYTLTQDFEGLTAGDFWR